MINTTEPFTLSIKEQIINFLSEKTYFGYIGYNDNFDLLSLSLALNKKVLLLDYDGNKHFSYTFKDMNEMTLTELSQLLEEGHQFTHNEIKENFKEHSELRGFEFFDSEHTLDNILHNIKLELDKQILENALQNQNNLELKVII